MIKTEPVICPLTCGFRWQQAPRAGLESPAYCLGGKPEPGRTTPPSPYVTLTWDDNRLTPPGSC
jgi:hypothetical protein